METRLGYNSAPRLPWPGPLCIHAAGRPNNAQDYHLPTRLAQKDPALINRNSPLAAQVRSSLLRDMEIDGAEIALRKQWLEFVEADVERLQELHPLAEKYADEIIDDFYRHLLTFEEARPFFADQQMLERVKRLQREYFLRLTEGNYNADYITNRLRIGAAHERIGLPIKIYLAMYNFYLRSIGARLIETEAGNPAQLQERLFALMKLSFLDMGLAIETYVFSRERTIHEQQEAIRELSTPVLQLREGLLILPIIGAIDTRRARQLTEQLLYAVRDNRAKVAVIDVTGVPSVDSRVANHLVQTVEAARLMGARVIVTGLAPEIAQTLVRLGVDLTKITTVGDLQGGIDEADRLLGYKVVRVEPAGAAPDTEGE